MFVRDVRRHDAPPRNLPRHPDPGRAERRQYGPRRPSLWRREAQQTRALGPAMAIPAADGYLATMTPAQSRAPRGALHWRADRRASAARIKGFVLREFDGEQSRPRLTAPG